MIVDKDSRELISIMEIKKEEAEIIVDAICRLFADRSLHTKLPEEKAVIRLKEELEKQY